MTKFKHNLRHVCILLVIAQFITFTNADDVTQELPSPINQQDLDLTILVPVHLENMIYLRNCLRSIYNALSEKPSLKYEILVFEVGQLSASKHHERKLGIQSSILNYDNTYLVHPDDQLDWDSLSTGLNSIILTSDQTTLTNDNKEQRIIARGKAILFLDEKIELLSGFFESPMAVESSFEELLGAARADREIDIGIVGTKLVRGDRSLYHAGIGFSMARLPKQTTNFRASRYNNYKRGNRINSMNDDQDDEKNVGMPYYLYQGYSADETRVSTEAPVTAVGLVGSLISSKLFRELGGFNESLSEAYIMIDLCLRASMEKSMKILYSPYSQSMYYGDIEKWDNKDEFRSFSDIWGSKLSKDIRDQWLIKNFTLVYSMECGKGQVLGFTTEAIGIVMSLLNKINLKVEIQNIGSCKDDMEAVGLPVSKIQLLERMSDIKIEGEVVIILHKDPGRYKTFLDSFMGKEPFYVIGRSMYETDRIPSKWVDKCNSLVNSIWVPSRFNVETFSSSGVNASLLETMPEPIDIYTYDPSITLPISLPFKRNFNFLSIMKWEKRKGWNILLESYLKEFTSKESVSLYIRSSMDAKNKIQFEEFLETFMKDNDRERNDLPQIYFLNEQIPFTQLPSLYKAVDSVVLATHGEGWGLPLIEGMSMELPVISTNWSGNTEFMTNENSYLVPVERMIDAEIEPQHQWAQPSILHLRQFMREIFNNPDKAKQVGKKARQDISRYRYEKLSELIFEKLRPIEQNMISLKAEKEAKKARQLSQEHQPSYNNNNNNNNDYNNNNNNKVQAGDRVKIKIVEDNR